MPTVEPVIEVTKAEDGILELRPYHIPRCSDDFYLFTDSPELAAAVPTRVRVRTGPGILETLRALVVDGTGQFPRYYLPFSEVGK